MNWTTLLLIYMDCLITMLPDMQLNRRSRYARDTKSDMECSWVILGIKRECIRETAYCIMILQHVLLSPLCFYHVPNRSWGTYLFWATERCCMRGSQQAVRHCREEMLLSSRCSSLRRTWLSRLGGWRTNTVRLSVNTGHAEGLD